jgi:hypothetical protein
LVNYGILLFLGLSISGYFIGRGLKMFRSGERTVTVKELAEKEVLADNIFWPVAYTVSDNDLIRLNEKIENYKKIIVDFLLSHGFKRNEISFSSLNVIDVQSQLYGQDRQYPFRYLAKGWLN